ncbi:MAG TPA: hypothetical protein DEA96_17090 [Leptospiraceae bacterium]|nr:hypothetical protein [Spirochaetaceae bacterium]HBS06687.1 hypothetical protein [Leptospiraceae bacterium]
MAIGTILGSMQRYRSTTAKRIRTLLRVRAIPLLFAFGLMVACAGCTLKLIQKANRPEIESQGSFLYHRIIDLRKNSRDELFLRILAEDSSGNKSKYDVQITGIVPTRDRGEELVPLAPDRANPACRCTSVPVSEITYLPIGLVPVSRSNLIMDVRFLPEGRRLTGSERFLYLLKEAKFFHADPTGTAVFFEFAGRNDVTVYRLSDSKDQIGNRKPQWKKSKSTLAELYRLNTVRIKLYPIEAQSGLIIHYPQHPPRAAIIALPKGESIVDGIQEIWLESEAMHYSPHGWGVGTIMAIPFTLAFDIGIQLPLAILKEIGQRCLRI